MTGDEQIECGPYACSLSVRSCAARHALSQEAGRVGRSRSHMALCRDCTEGRERWVQLGGKRKEAPATVPKLRRARERSLEVYVPRTECGQ